MERSIQPFSVSEIGAVQPVEIGNINETVEEMGVHVIEASNKCWYLPEGIF